MTLRDIWKEVQLIWNHQEPEERMVHLRGPKEQSWLQGIRILSLSLLFISTLFHYFIDAYGNHLHYIFLLASILLYVPVWVSGWLHQDYIGGSLRSIGMLALLCQIPYVLLYDHLLGNPAIWLFILLLAARLGWAYIPILLIATWLSKSFELIRVESGWSAIVWWATLIVIFAWPIACTRFFTRRLPADAWSQAGKTANMNWPLLYGVLLIIGLIYVYGILH